MVENFRYRCHLCVLEEHRDDKKIIIITILLNYIQIKTIYTVYNYYCVYTHIYAHT